ncbi:MAG: hypothetical protein CSB44_09260 [Gammaproteobacteria bacterium]|nr:MAG: hypothetical protein CSB44_09260 [Gammaproteobacteria bacterium]
MKRTLFLLLIAISAIGPLALNGVLPATGAVMDEYEASFADVQYLLTLFLVANLVSQLVLGPAADRYGRRPIMLGGLALFIVGSVACALAPSIEALMLARFLQGFGGAVCVFLPRTIVRDLYTRDRAASVIAYMTTAMMAAPLFGPALGGWITDNLGWHMMYWGFTGFGMLLLVATWYFQEETLRVHSGDDVSLQSGQMTLPGQTSLGKESLEASEHRAATVATRWRHPMLQLITEPAYIAHVIVLAGSVGVYYAFLSGAPFVAMESRGMSAGSYGRWFFLIALGYMSGNFVAGHLSEHLGGRRMIHLGLLPFSLAVVLFWLFSGASAAPALFLPMMLVAFSNGLQLPNLISGAIGVRPDLAASASGLAGSIQTGIGVLVSLFLAAILPAGDVWLFVTISACYATAVAGLVFYRRVVPVDP